MNLIIQAPKQGISQSPHVGFSNMRNLDITSIPGIVALNNIQVKKSATTVTDNINWFVRNPVTTAEVYALGDTGKVYKSLDSGATWALLAGNVFTVTIASPAVFSDVAHGLLENDTVVFATTGALPTGLTAGTIYYIIATGLTADAFQVSTTQGGAAVNTSGTESGTHTMRATTNANGNGMVIFKNYLFVCRNTRIDVCGNGTATGIASNAWTFNWKAIDSDLLWHPMLISKNDSKVYGGAGRFVFSLDENTGQTFAPATAATFTFTVQALDLPSPYRIKCLEELGNNLMCGTWQGTAITDIRVADIFPWDRSSVSFGQPIIIDDYGIHAMKNTGNSLIVLAGISGTIRKCDGVNSIIVGQIPTDIRGGKYIEFYPNSICNYKGKIFFGTGQGGTTAVPDQGIYSLLQTGQGSVLNMEHSVSTLSDGTTNPLKVTALLPITRDTLLAGWRDNTTYGIDLTTATSYFYTTDYSGYFETPLYTVGTSLQLTKFTNIEFQLVRPLRTGEGIKIEFRDDLTASYTTLNTYDFATWADIVSHNSTFAVTTNDMPALETLQLKISLLGRVTTSPELKSITLK